MSQNIICFGQQPCGIFPKRFLLAKIVSAKKLQGEIGGKILFFYHDSDHDYRETITVLHDRTDNREVRLNFLQENKLQKKYTPLYLKRIPKTWQEKIARKLHRFIDKALIDLFVSIKENYVADFCLSMYEKMGLFEGIQIIRSSDKTVRVKAIDLEEFFADVEYQGEIVRAKYTGNKLMLHRGGTEYIELPAQRIEKIQKSPMRDSRLKWMQSVLHCTHYVTGKGESKYLNVSETPEIKFVVREDIENPDDAYINFYTNKREL